MQKYPIGIQDFKTLCTEDYWYVYKTAQIFQLFQNKYYFLSSLRRFCKPLLLSTLKEIFSGSQDLFKRLWIEDKINWKSYTIIHLSFGNASFKDMGLEAYIRLRLDEVAEANGLQLSQMVVGERFRELILKMS